MASVHLYLVFSSASYGLVEPEGEASHDLHAEVPALAEGRPLAGQALPLDLADLLFAHAKPLGRGLT